MRIGLTKDEILARYPENKPICFNYSTARVDLLALVEEKEALRHKLTGQAEKV